MKSSNKIHISNSCLWKFINYQIHSFTWPQGHRSCLRETFILGVGLFFLGFSMIQAQDIEFGVKAGANFANDTGEGEFDTGSSTKAGIHLGGVAHLILSEKFGVQGELLYSMQGFKDEVTHKLDYINLPIMANYTLVENLRVQAGPQFGFNIRDTFDDAGNSDSLDAKGFDFSAIFGAQYEFSMGLFVQGRYQFGLVDFLDYDSPSKHAVLSVSIGYFF